MNKTDEKLKSAEVWVEEDIFAPFFIFLMEISLNFLCFVKNVELWIIFYVFILFMRFLWSGMKNVSAFLSAEIFVFVPFFVLEKITLRTQKWNKNVLIFNLCVKTSRKEMNFPFFKNKKRKVFSGPWNFLRDDFNKNFCFEILLKRSWGGRWTVR